MSKLVLALSFLGVALLFTLGLVDPNNSIMWVASTSNDFAILRLFMLVILAGLLVTDPPRNRYFRMFVGVLSVSLVAWSLGATYHNQMKLLDSLALLEVGVSSALVVLERGFEEPKPVYKKTRSGKLLQVSN